MMNVLIVHFYTCSEKEIFGWCDNLYPYEARVESYTSQKSPSRTCIEPYFFMRRVRSPILNTRFRTSVSKIWLCARSVENKSLYFIKGFWW